MYFIFGNYGNNTIALIQWAKENNLKDVYVIHAETGWAAPAWSERICLGQQLATAYAFQVMTVTAKKNFFELVREQKNFPSKKFQWCTSFLKALPFLAWLDEKDPHCEATILLGSRRDDSRARANLAEYIPESEHYNERRVWYPLYQHDNSMRDALIRRSGLEILPHRSLECEACIYSISSDRKKVTAATLAKITELENELAQTLFPECNDHDDTPALEAFDMGCGSYYVCGE